MKFMTWHGHANSSWPSLCLCYPAIGFTPTVLVGVCVVIWGSGSFHLSVFCFVVYLRSVSCTQYCMSGLFNVNWPFMMFSNVYLWLFHYRFCYWTLCTLLWWWIVNELSADLCTLLWWWIVNELSADLYNSLDFIVFRLLQ